MAVQIILDAGHGGFDNGAVFRERNEKDEVLRLALAVGEKLEQAGYPVGYTRTEDIYESPYQKAQRANEMGGQFFISFHRNSAIEDNLYQGVQALVCDMENEESVMLGENINREMEKLGFRNLGTEAIPDLIVLKNTQMPAVLVEIGFINSEEDNELFDTKFEEIVQAAVNGIELTLPVKVQEVETTHRFFVQTGLFKYDVNAAYQLERLQILGFDGTIHYEEPYYGVWVGSTQTLEEAVDLQNQLRENGYSTFIVAE
ncbi:Sporulation-specific N-acetylmuramoyl-L-alanine amidase [uncultured Roseburia sp.]|uniref:N-acetylmuramoyl-L-alanine amidase n=1 Tax=Brotonthovivens ammoniilytica TaxID=2981725 RepID=A0ABT2TK47_9FIRM|nr:N-acetylmuramoyl-L-alanine amidase [Brotonthovivens ammoniilytica]MCU6762590.1 N-acetylmuramoyl-L-alanine amidase [Brotonthovivens ammoniilytica]SCI76640.1 Sporulation-specific N-acetylmuramoyl-L-alanine amidase [uncultured Roseburia sp.]